MALIVLLANMLDLRQAHGGVDANRGRRDPSQSIDGTNSRRSASVAGTRSAAENEQANPVRKRHAVQKGRISILCRVPYGYRYKSQAGGVREARFEIVLDET